MKLHRRHGLVLGTVALLLAVLSACYSPPPSTTYIYRNRTVTQRPATRYVSPSGVYSGGYIKGPTGEGTSFQGGSP